MRVIIETIRHAEQRYQTCGDWLDEPNGDLVIRVSRLGDWRYEMLVGVHEAIEALLCRNAGVAQETVDNFDIGFENARRIGKDCEPISFDYLGHACEPQAEPGDHPAAPYRKQHAIATGVERILAAELGVDWTDYEGRVNGL